jgi:glutamate-1-semialdehyde 2,1-aminomutase
VASRVVSGSPANLALPRPMVAASADGGRIRDVDGREYLDLMLGFGAMVLGHRHPRVETAVRQQLECGWHFGVTNRRQEQLAELVHELVPTVESIMFCNSGTEATMYAFRLARAFTGRSKIAVVDGFYHGAHDYGMLRSPTGRGPLNPRQLGAGVPVETTDSVTVLPWASSTLDEIRGRAHELAAVVVEPVQSSNPRLDDASTAFLQQLQTTCQDVGVLLILDEVITGFRLGPGGAQVRLGLQPDLTTFGKVLGGGLPVGAVGGSAEMIRLFRGLHDGDPRGVFSGGSFSGNPLTMTAGLATLQVLRDGPTAYGLMDARTTRLADTVNQWAASHGVPVRVMAAGSIFQVFFQSDPVHSYRDVRGAHPAEDKFYLALMDAHVFIPGNHRAFLGTCHTDDDVDQVIAAMLASLRSCDDAGLFAEPELLRG